LEGLNVVTAVAAVPAFRPDSNLQAFNALANAIGDDRAAKAKATWGRPLKAIVITGTGVL
jgi:hypothetical protein